MTWQLHRRARLPIAHAIEYDPRRDIDHIRKYAITRCGLQVHPNDLGDALIGVRQCLTCQRLRALDESRPMPPRLPLQRSLL